MLDVDFRERRKAEVRRIFLLRLSEKGPSEASKADSGGIRQVERAENGAHGSTQGRAAVAFGAFRTVSPRTPLNSLENVPHGCCALPGNRLPLDRYRLWSRVRTLPRSTEQRGSAITSGRSQPGEGHHVERRQTSTLLLRISPGAGCLLFTFARLGTSCWSRWL